MPSSDDNLERLAAARVAGKVAKAEMVEERIRLWRKRRPLGTHDAHLLPRRQGLVQEGRRRGTVWCRELRCKACGRQRLPSAMTTRHCSVAGLRMPRAELKRVWAEVVAEVQSKQREDAQLRAAQRFSAWREGRAVSPGRPRVRRVREADNPGHCRSSALAGAMPART